jgi:hypothetical protein
VVWRVDDAAKTGFDVDNYRTTSLQSEAACPRVIVAYDHGDVEPGGAWSRRCSAAASSSPAHWSWSSPSGWQSRRRRRRGAVDDLAYAPEIAQVMLRRQQAEASSPRQNRPWRGIDGRDGVERAVGEKVVELDDERGAAMVSNLMTVLCAERGSTGDQYRHAVSLTH